MVATAGAISGSGSSLISSPSTSQMASLNLMGSGVMSLASGFASLQASKMQARQYKIQGIFQDLALSQEKLRGREQAVFLRKKFLDNLSSAKASFAHRGVSMGSGIGRQFAIQTMKSIQEDAQAAQLNSQAAQIQLKLDASQTKLAKETAKNLGYVQSSQQFVRGTQNLLTGFQTIK